MTMPNVTTFDNFIQQILQIYTDKDNEEYNDT